MLPGGGRVSKEGQGLRGVLGRRPFVEHSFVLVIARWRGGEDGQPCCLWVEERGEQRAELHKVALKPQTFGRAFPALLSAVSGLGQCLQCGQLCCTRAVVLSTAGHSHLFSSPGSCSH